MSEILPLLVPHGVIELVFIIGASQFSTLLSYQFLKYINSSFENKDFLKMFFSTRHFIIYTIVTSAAIIECYITPKIYLFFKN